tara:strand:- start:150 stop:335 length:186 start_codon:yes stop_codon:yes gene_type:complete
MSRKNITIYRDALQLYIFYGWDIDVKQWFIDVKLKGFEQGSITKWFTSEEKFKKTLKKFII